MAVFCNVLIWGGGISLIGLISEHLCVTVLGFYYSNGTACSRFLVPVLLSTEWQDRWVGCQVGIFTASKTGGFWTLLLRQIDWS